MIPMLPHRLSNGICSLNAGCDRLALSCLMDMDEKGNITGHEICETVVRIDRRMTYTAVNAVLTGGNTDESLETEGFGSMFRLLDEAAGILRKKRMERGAVDFDFAECKILLDEKGRPEALVPRERNAATMLIEDFMLAANETVAEDYYWQQIPFLYRTHEKPDEEKIRRFAILINNFGYSLHIGNGEVHPKEIQKLLSRAVGTPEEAMLSRLALRSMKQAKYTTGLRGPFRSGSPVLYTFYIPHPQVSGSADPPDHQGEPPWQTGRKTAVPLWKAAAGGRSLDLLQRTAGRGGRTGNGEGEKGPVHGAAHRGGF